MVSNRLVRTGALVVGAMGLAAALLAGPLGWGPVEADPPLVEWHAFSDPSAPAVNDDPDYRFLRGPNGEQLWQHVPAENLSIDGGFPRAEISRDEDGWVHIRGLAIGWGVPATHYPVTYCQDLVSGQCAPGTSQLIADGTPYKLDVAVLPECYRPATVSGSVSAFTDPANGGDYVSGFVFVDPDGTLSVKAYGGPTGTADEVQRIAVDNNSGSFTIDLGGFGLDATAAIPADATSVEVQAALESVDGLDVGDLTVTDGGVGPGVDHSYLVRFNGQYAVRDVPALVATGTGGTSATVSEDQSFSNGAPGKLFAAGLPGHDGLTGSVMADLELSYQTEAAPCT